MRLCCALLALVLLLAPVPTWSANQTVGTIPTRTSSFYTDLAAFLRTELPAILSRYFSSSGFVVSGGVHATSGTMVSASFATEAFTGSGNRASADGAGGAVAINYSTVGCASTDTAWVIISAASGAALSNFQRVGSSNYFVNCVDTTLPTLPSDSTYLMRVTIAGSALTVVDDLRVFTPVNSQAMSRVINVTQAPYYAPRDGIGDAAPGINSALVDASASGYTVFLPCGTYKTRAQILLKDNTALIGASKDCAIIAPDTATTIARPVLASSVSHWTVQDLQVDCGDATVTGRQGIAALNTASYGTIANVYVRRCGQYGVLLAGDLAGAPYSSGGQGMVLRDSRIDMTGIAGGSCTGTIAVEYFPKGPVSYLATPGPVVTGNTIVAATADGGIKLSNSLGASITNNYVSGATCSTAAGAIIAPPGNQDMVVSGNRVYNTRTGLTFGGAPLANASGGNELRLVGALITHNTIDTFTLYGMLSTDGATDVTLTGNYITPNGGTSTGHGMDIQPQAVAGGGFHYTRLTLANNTLVGNQIGLYLQESSDSAYGYVGLKILGNTVSSALATGRAIDVTQAPYAVVTDNQIVGHRNAISLGTGSDFVDLSHNTARDLNSGNTASQACYILVGTDPRILGNTCINTSGSYHAHWGLSLNNTQRAVIAGNIFSGMETGDITLAGTAMTAATPMPQAMYVDQAATNAPADTSEDTIATVTIPANYFTLFGGVSITAFGDTTGGGGTKDLRLYFGAALLGSALNIASGTNAYRFEADVVMPVVNAATEHAWVKGYDAGTLELAVYQSSAVNTTTGTVEIKVTCQKASAGDACRSRALLVKPWR